jgi:hypothetical protein
MSNDQFVFNGIDGSSGNYLLLPKTAQELFQELIHTPDQRQDLDSRKNELKQRVDQQNEGSFGPPAGTDPQNLDEVGWGVIFAHDAKQEIYDALKELLDFRRSQAGEFYKEFRKHLGYRVGDPEENHRTFLARQNMTFGPPDPKRVPYYLLIVGDPESIPFQFQYMLDVQYAVGRIYFDTVEEYAQYAHSVVEAERGQLTRRRRLVLAGVANPDDGATEASATILLPNLENELKEGKTARGWTIETRPPQQTHKDQMLRLIGGDETPALLFTASHGVAFRDDPTRQQNDQGALLCQDWPGKIQWGSQPIPEQFYIAARDIGDDARLWGSIFFHFACFGAGTPRFDDFAHARQLNWRETIAPHAFVAPLPRRLLSHPKGGVLAVIGHVDQAWTYSFQLSLEGVNVGGFRDAMRTLMKGQRVGFAMEAFNIRFAELATTLTKDLEDIKFGKIAKPNEITRLWMAHNDARSYVIIGDPAVCLTFDDQADEPPRTLDPAHVPSSG